MTTDTKDTTISPLPWKVEQVEFEGEQWLWLDDGTGKAICGFSDPDDGIDDEDRANAAYIVQACNSYPALVAALRELLKWSDHNDDCDLHKHEFVGLCTCGYRQVYRQVDAALTIGDEQL
jgi:hypothetical protein